MNRDLCESVDAHAGPLHHRRCTPPPKSILSMSALSSFMGQALVAKTTTKVQSSKTTTQALFKKAAPKKAAPKTGKSAKPASGKAVKGWGGGDATYDLDKWYGPNRKLYLPGGLLDSAEVPTYLTGELAGDYGYDPLGLGQTPEQVADYRKQELIHARWAMVATIGCLLPEAANTFGDGTQITGAVWWQVCLLSCAPSSCL